MNRNEFKEKAKKSIDNLFIKIDELERKKDQARDDAKGKYEKVIFELKSKRNELEARLQAASVASDEKWEEFKETFEDSMSSFREGFDKLTGFFK
jgi:DNA-directed RNA polymerase alpha subunit